MQEMWAFVPGNFQGVNRSKTPWVANCFVFTLDFLHFFWSAQETDTFQLERRKGLAPMEEELSQGGTTDLDTPALDAAKRAVMT
jgi:hypothetical protein